MQLDEDLEIIKRSDSSCRMVAFGDLRARLALRVVSDQSFARESLDQILLWATHAFSMADAAADIQSTSASAPDHAVMIVEDVVHIFVRSTKNHADVLCCTCESYENVDTLIESAREFFGLMARVA